tara:strand:- start:590 stop:1093 length:504 start_codon:yes stop_codon:yes gene_type:complete
METNTTSLLFLDWIGYLGPFILMIINIYALWIQPYYLVGYFISLFFSSIINRSLKYIYKEPRPMNEISMEDIDIFNWTGVKDIYGMPSGHAQSVSYSLMYLYLVQGSGYMALLNITILGLTLFQRWNYRKHTIIQLLVGTIVGLTIGFLAFYIIKMNLEDTKTKTVL